jgi:lantibiotic modifying enzyme
VTGAWEPLLSGAAAARAEAIARAIAGDLVERGLESSASVAGGAAGSALFFDYAGKVLGDVAFERRASERLEHAAQLVANGKHPPSLHVGFAGMGFAWAHLCDGGTDSDDLEEIDRAVEVAIDSDSPLRQCDLINGLLGFGVYFLERMPNPGAARALVRIAERIADRAEEHPLGRCWFTQPSALLSPARRRQYPEGYYDLGLAHGVAGTITLLGALTRTLSRPADRRLLQAAIAWLLSRRLPATFESWFDCFVLPGQLPELKGSRTAWCYGDPGVALALWNAGDAAGVEEWKKLGSELARDIARRDPGHTGIIDAGFCHGAAGVAHILHRFARWTNDDAIADGARVWFGAALDMACPGQGMGGYRFWTGQDKGWVDEPGLLVGATGVGLSLLAAIGSIPPEWDRVLLISTREPGDHHRESDS